MTENIQTVLSYDKLTSNLFKTYGIDIKADEIKFSKVTIISYGGGQDSHTILEMCCKDKEFRMKYAPHRLIAIFADTGNEHPFTYDFIERVTKPLCKKYGIEFVQITNDMGFHSEGWMSLTHQWKRNRPTIGSMAYPKSCSHNLKLFPQYNYIGYLLAKENNLAYGRKREYVNYAKTNGKIRWLIGIAKNEEQRVNGKFFYRQNTSKNEGILKIKKSIEIFEVKNKDKSKLEYEVSYEGSDRFINVNNKLKKIEFEYNVIYDQKWKEQSIITEYPLLDIGFDRTACQEYLNSIGSEIPFPSNCIFCPFSSGSHMELLWLYKNLPDRFYEWVQLEEAKLNYFKNNHQFIFNKIIDAKTKEKIKIEVDTLDAQSLDFMKEQLSIAICEKKQITISCVNYIEVKEIEEFINKKSIVVKVKVPNLGATARTHKHGDRKDEAFTLLDMLEEAKAKFQDVTLEELQRWKHSHGHCTSSKF